MRQWTGIVVCAAGLLAACDLRLDSLQQGKAAKSDSEASASATPRKPNYERCAGSYEMEKCRAEEERLASETPEQAAARRKQMDEDRAKTIKAVAAIPPSETPEPPAPRKASKAPEPEGEPERESMTTALASEGGQAMVVPGGWVCDRPTDAIQYSRLRRAGVSVRYQGCSQIGAPLLVRVLQRTALAGTPIVNVGNAGAAGWTIDEDLQAVRR
jgi:hypothetical protein